MIHLRSIMLDDRHPLPDGFPFTVPVVQSLRDLHFTQDVTFFVGENGSGKSTILEAIAVAAALPTIGSYDVADDASLANINRLGERLRWSWNQRVRHGFFMRSEDFFGFARRISTEMDHLKGQLDSSEDGHKGQSEFAKRIAKMPYAREYHALKDLYGDGLDVQSHGESYFKLFQSRFRAGGLYLMDEPEAPLSPMRQLSLIAMLSEMVKQNAQFIIATHSPILLAYPNATIYNFNEGQIESVSYEDLEHVTLTRSFLNNPQAYLKHLIDT